MAEKTRWIPVTNEDEADELTKDPADLALPLTFKPNGQLWAHAEQYEAWRALKEAISP